MLPSRLATNDRSTLSDVDRELPQVAQRRVARPEVVDREADAERLEGAERGDGRLDVVDQDALGDLEGQARGSSPDTDRTRADVGDEVRVGHLAARHVDADRQARRPVSSCHALVWRQALSRIQRPSSRISPLSSASGMNSIGGIGAALGVVPAHERLRPGDRTGVELDDRLVRDVELAALEGAAEVGLQLHPGDGRAVELRLVDDVAVAAAGLGRVHRDVGAAQQLVGIAAVGRLDGDADAGPGRDLALAEHERPGEGLEDPRARTAPASSASVSSTMIANSSPPSRATVSPARVADAQPLADGDEQPVALGVAETVVDGLEVVEVEVQDRGRSAAAAGPGQGVTEAVAEQRPVGQTRSGRRGTPGGGAAPRAPSAR